MSSPGISEENLYGESLNPETIVRIRKHERNFLVVENTTVQDERLSWEARGLLVYLLSLPKGWKIRIGHLQKQGGAGRDAVRRILRELQELGYASGVGRESQERGERGRFGQTEIVAYESPSLNPFHTKEKSPSPENPSTVAQPSTDSPSTDLPSPENPSTYKERNSQKTQRQQKTHTTQRRAGLRAVGAPEESADAGVGVVDSKSRFSFEVRKAHAAANGLGSGWLQKSRDGSYDELIADAIERSKPEAVEASRVATIDNRIPYGAALQLVGSVLSRGGPGSDPSAEIERLFESAKISEEVRARLHARDWRGSSSDRAA
jgi:hypothetical protein